MPSLHWQWQWHSFGVMGGNGAGGWGMASHYSIHPNCVYQAFVFSTFYVLVLAWTQRHTFSFFSRPSVSIDAHWTAVDGGGNKTRAPHFRMNRKKTSEWCCDCLSEQALAVFVNRLQMRYFFWNLIAIIVRNNNALTDVAILFVTLCLIA